ncbi:hypothetical protein ACFXTH_025612 [Malus domestica]
MEIANVRDKLGVLFEHPPSPDMHKRRGKLMQELDNLLGREETFWRQRARTQWLKEVRFFHTRASINNFGILWVRKWWRRFGLFCSLAI